MYSFHQFKNTFILLGLPLGSLLAQNSKPIETESLTVSYPQALQLAIENNPQLKLIATRIEASEGNIEQAGVRPNPVVEAEMENILGTGPASGIEGLEVTIGITQAIETADKRNRRKALAIAEQELIHWEREALLADLETSVRKAFVDVLLAQQLLNLRIEQWELAKRSAEETNRLVEAAHSPVVEQTRARLAVRRHQFAMNQTERELKAAKSILASFWSETIAVSFTVIGELKLESETPEFSSLLSRLKKTAPLSRFSAEEGVRRAALELEQARASPDIEVFAASRYYNHTDGDVGFLVGIEVPWPIFDRNRGNIRAARARLRGVRQEHDTILRQLRIALTQSYQELLNAQEEAKAIQEELLPVAELTLHDTEAGYQRGQFNQLSVLESRSVLFEIREAYLDALQRYIFAQSQIEKLTRPATLEH